MNNGDKDLERLLADLLEVKNKHGLDNHNFLVLLGMVNLMGIINLMEARPKEGRKVHGPRKPAQEKAPFMSLF